MRSRETSQPKAPRTACVWLALLLAAVGLSRAFPGWPSPTTHLRDDAFYEFLFAENLASGSGPVVTGEQWTSGVQPLWCCVLALCALVGASVPKAAVVLGVACHVAASVLWVRALRGTWIGVVAGAAWLGNPLLLRECQNGQETALGALFAVLLWNSRHTSLPRFAALAAVAGLARADLFAFALLLTLGRSRESTRARVLAALAPFVPWLVWNRVTGGGLLPDSSLPMAWLAHAQFERTAPTFVDWLRREWWYLRPVLFGAPFALAGAAGIALLLAELARPSVARALRFAPLAAVAAASVLGADDLGVPTLAATFLLLTPATRQEAAMPRGSLLLRAEGCLLLAGLAVVGLHWALRWYPRDYYLAPLAVLAVAGFVRARRRPWLVLLALLSHGVFTLRAPLAHEDLRHQAAMQVAGSVLRPLLGDRARVGSFNCGLIAWEQRRHGERAPVVLALDGLVDARAFAALREARLDDHLDRVEVDFLVDFPVQWSMESGPLHAVGPWFGAGADPGRDLVVFARCADPDADGRVRPSEVAIAWRQSRRSAPRPGGKPAFVARTEEGVPVLLWHALAGEVLEADRGEGYRPWWRAPEGGLYALGVRRPGPIRVVGELEPIPPPAVR